MKMVPIPNTAHYIFCIIVSVGVFGTRWFFLSFEVLFLEESKF